VLYPRQFFVCAATALALTGLPCAQAGNTAIIGVSFTVDSACRISKTPQAEKQEMPGVTCLHDESVAVAKGTVTSNFTPAAIEENAGQSGVAASETGEPIWIVSF
jgi:hypothetical protein